MSDRIQANRVSARGNQRERPGQGADEHGARSLARPEMSAHGVVLPALKMDLAVVLLVLGVLGLTASLVAWPPLIEAACLFAGSMAACGWLAMRTRAVVRRLESGDGGRDGAE